jgi:hypothetical protein
LAFPFLGVTVNDKEHVPILRVFTDVPETLQILLDDAATLMTTLAVDGIVIFAFVEMQVREMDFPRRTEHNFC